MFFVHIAYIMTQDIAVIDTTNSKSAFFIILFKNKKGHATMIVTYPFEVIDRKV